LLGFTVRRPDTKLRPRTFHTTFFALLHRFKTGFTL